MRRHVEEIDEDELVEAARQVCLNRSDDWDNEEDRANSMQDARTAIEVYLGVES